MQLPTGSAFFNSKNVETILKRENKFISDLLDISSLPDASAEPDNEYLLESSRDARKNRFRPQVPNKAKTSRAKSLVELQQRLAEISSRKRLSYKEKLLKKTIKTKIKRKGKQGQRNADKKLERTKTLVKDVKNETTTESVSPEASQAEGDGRMVFSKFDFTGLGKSKSKKEKHDPEKKLQDLKKQKEKVNKLRESGEVEKANVINEKTAWKNALAKAQGEKVKDDEQLLTKTIQKREQKRQRSKKKWEARQENVEKQKDERQKKRQENIDKRKKDKIIKKKKQAVKKGKIIPGF